jgi:hypothetical protein
MDAKRALAPVFMLASKRSASPSLRKLSPFSGILTDILIMRFKAQQHRNNFEAFCLFDRHFLAPISAYFTANTVSGFWVIIGC